MNRKGGFGGLISKTGNWCQCREGEKKGGEKKENQEGWTAFSAKEKAVLKGKKRPEKSMTRLSQFQAAQSAREKGGTQERKRGGKRWGDKHKGPLDQKGRLNGREQTKQNAI